MADLRPNHHADYRQFGGVFGYLAGLTMIMGRGVDADLVAGIAHLDADDHVVDIGCGPGTAVRTAARHGARATGVDPAGPMLALARLLTRLRRPEGDIEWVQAGAEQLTLPDDSVTVCWSLMSVHHWPHLDESLAEVQRILRPGGLFIALEKNTKPGATGAASHGWTDQQAETFAAMLTDRGYTSAEVRHHERARRRVVTVTGRV